MQEGFAPTLDDLTAVWLRVRGHRMPPEKTEAPDEDARLLRFIGEAYGSMTLYTALAKMFPSAGRSLLLGQAQECKNRCRSLRAEYFIRTGISCNPNEPCPLPGGKLFSLRAALYRAEEQADAFRHAARKAQSETLRALYLRFAEQAERHARDDRALLLECF